jgi:hypothetical protein
MLVVENWALKIGHWSLSLKNDMRDSEAIANDQCSMSNSQWMLLRPSAAKL